MYMYNYTIFNLFWYFIEYDGSYDTSTIFS